MSFFTPPLLPVLQCLDQHNVAVRRTVKADLIASHQLGAGSDFIDSAIGIGQVIVFLRVKTAKPDRQRCGRCLLQPEDLEKALAAGRIEKFPAAVIAQLLGTVGQRVVIAVQVGAYQIVLVLRLFEQPPTSPQNRLYKSG